MIDPRIQQVSARDRSYRVRETIPPGTRVKLTGDSGRLLAGATGTVSNYANAGFRGIVAYVEMDEAPEGWPERIAELAAEDSFWQGHNPRRFEVSAGLLETIR